MKHTVKKDWFNMQTSVGNSIPWGAKEPTDPYAFGQHQSWTCKSYYETSKNHYLLNAPFDLLAHFL